MKKKLTSALLGLSLLGQYATVSPTYAIKSTSENQYIQTQDKNKKANTTQDQNKETETTDNKILTPKNIAIAGTVLGIPLAAGLLWYFWPSGEKEKQDTPEDINAYREFVLKMWNDENQWVQNIQRTIAMPKTNSHLALCNEAFECLKNAFRSLSENGSFDPRPLQEAFKKANASPTTYDVECLQRIYGQGESCILDDAKNTSREISKMIYDSQLGDDIDMVKKAIKDTLEKFPYFTKKDITEWLKKFYAALEEHLNKKPINCDEMDELKIQTWRHEIELAFRALQCEFKNGAFGSEKDILPEANKDYQNAYVCMLDVFRLLNTSQKVPDKKIQELVENFKKIGITLASFSENSCRRVCNFVLCNEEVLERKRTALLQEAKRIIWFEPSASVLQDDSNFYSIFEDWKTKELGSLYEPNDTALEDIIQEFNEVRQKRLQDFEQATPENYKKAVEEVFNIIHTNIGKEKFREFYDKTVNQDAEVEYLNAHEALKKAFELLLEGKQITDAVANQLAEAFKEIGISHLEINGYTIFQIWNTCYALTPEELNQWRLKNIDNITKDMREELDDETLNSDEKFEDWTIGKLGETDSIPRQYIPTYFEKLLEIRKQIIEERKKVIASTC